MSATMVELLKAAAQIMGGEAALARRLGIADGVLARYMSGDRALPDTLLLRAVDIILADRQHRYGIAGAPVRDLSAASGPLQNSADGIAANNKNVAGSE